MTLHVVTEGPEGGEEGAGEYNVRSEEADYTELDGEYWDQRYGVKAEHDILCIEHEDVRFKSPTPRWEVRGKGRGGFRGRRVRVMGGVRTRVGVKS